MQVVIDLSESQVKRLDRLRKGKGLSREAAVKKALLEALKIEEDRALLLTPTRRISDEAAEAEAVAAVRKVRAGQG